MEAVLAIELELLEPALVASAQTLRDLPANQIRWVAVRLDADGVDPVTLSSNARLFDLVALAQKAQPEGTAVRVWYQGRSEEFIV